MKTVWKFPLAMERVQDVLMPHGARILTVQPQGKTTVNLWALVETTAAPEQRRICILGTGNDAPDYGVLKHISTFQMNDGKLIFHAFEMVDV